MKWYIIFGAVIIIVAGAWFFFSGSSNNESTTPTQTPELPLGGSVTPGSIDTGSSGSSVSNPTITFGTPNGGVVTVKDFIHNGETVSDVENPGSYVLAGSVGYCLANGSCPSGATTTDFNVSYNEKTHFFNIILLAEPLGSVRLEAEQFLASRLGLVDKEVCDLNYFVGTPYWINATYDNKNLGFSFCPGATVLPK
ncbi:MAG: hypothetical protein PHD04_04335 [Candidatus Pacebacteria bacterium]|nr:hypothetical protein [Candidatus Paceibacterota bacterium]